MSEKHPSKVCGTCLRVLDYLEEGDSGLGRYCHVSEEYGQRTHVAVAVDPEEVENVATVCDFCFVSKEEGGDNWTVVAHPFALEVWTPGGSTSQNFSSLWAACDGCADLVRRRRWSALVTRVVKEQARRDPSMTPEVRSFRKVAITALYARLEANYITTRPSRPGDLKENDYAPAAP